MRTKHLVLVVAIVLATFTQLQAQPAVETINVDTLVYLGKGVNGQAGGALFLPDGNVIALWRSIPHIINGKTGEVLRRLDTVHSSILTNPKLSKDGAKLVALSMGPILNVWDVPTGKIIKTLQNINDYFFAPDGSKLYVCGGNSSKLGAIRVLDINTFEEIERFGSFVSGSYMDISPDGQTLALAAFKEPNDEYDTKTNQVILIDLKDKTKYTTLETFDPQVNSMEFSPDGKQIAFLHNGSSSFDDVYIYIYNLETKEKKYLRMPEFSTLFGFNVMVIGRPIFIDNNSIFTGIANSSGSKYYYFCWNIPEHKIKNYINIKYNQSLYTKDSTLLLCNQNGVIGYLNKNIVPVKENEIENDYLSYRNNQLEYYSDKSFLGQLTVYDTTGKMILNLGTHQFIVGRNEIKVNQPLPIGAYLLIIKNGTEQISKKFLVE